MAPTQAASPCLGEWGTLWSHNLNAHWDGSKASGFSSKEKQEKKRTDEERVRQKQSHSLRFPFPSMRILVSSSGPTAFTVTHQSDEEPNCVEHLPGGGKGVEVGYADSYREK